MASAMPPNVGSLESKDPEQPSHCTDAAPACPPARRQGSIALLCIGLSMSFFSTGVIFGWPSLVVMLKEDNTFAELCSSGSNGCDAQKERFNLCFTIGQFGLCAGFLVNGMMLDRCGPRRTAQISLGFSFVGTFLLGVSDSETLDALAPSLFLLSFGGSGIHLSLFHISNLFLTARNTIVSLIVGAFVASGMVWTIFHSIVTSQSTVDRVHVFSCAQCSLFVLFFVVVSRLWPAQMFNPGDQIQFTNCWCLEYTVIPEEDLAKATAAQNPQWLLPVFEQMRQKPYLAILLFFGVHYVRYLWYVGTSNDQLERQGDDDNAYAKLLPIALALGAVAVPVVGQGLDKIGFVWMILATNVIAVLYNSLQMISHLELQAVTFVLLSIFRVCIFCIMFSFLQQEFGPKSFGRLSGAMLFISSCVAFSVPAMLYLVNSTLDGDFLYVNLAFALCVIPVFVTPYYLWRRSHVLACVVVPQKPDLVKDVDENQ